jgi:hypothetical protein
MEFRDVDWLHLAQNNDHWQAYIGGGSTLLVV